MITRTLSQTHIGGFHRQNHIGGFHQATISESISQSKGYINGIKQKQDDEC